MNQIHTSEELKKITNMKIQITKIQNRKNVSEHTSEDISTIQVILVLPLQNASKTSKVKYHFLALERRFELWDDGNMNNVNSIQERLVSNNTPTSIEKSPKNLSN